MATQLPQYTLKGIIERYESNNRKPIIFDFKSASQNLLSSSYDKDNRYINYIHYYPGRIYPYIPLYILSLDDFAHLDGCLLDPFAGSGTILLESIINSVIKRNSIGVEINPLARLISKVKTTPIEFGKTGRLTRELDRLYSQVLDSDISIPSFKNINLWFSLRAIKRLARLKCSIENLDAPADYKDFFWICFSRIIRKVSKANPYIPPPVVLKPEKYENSLRREKLSSLLERAEDPDVWNLFESVVENNKSKLETLHNFEEIANGEVKAEIIWDDARRIRKGVLSERGGIVKNSPELLPSNSVDIIFTSPPYLTAQKYMRTTRLELLWMGYGEEEIRDLDRLSIGTEKVYVESEISALGISSIDSLVDCAVSTSKKRGLMVYKYFENMIKALKEMHRLLRKRGCVILVVGSNKVLGKKVDTYRLLRDAAITSGFTEIVILKDEIRTRSMMTARNGSGGLIKDEHVIILKKES